jgi:DNA-binding transcriptional ArsR family regulator
MRSTEQVIQPRLSWDFGTAYDLFVSLAVLHRPDDFGLRPSWAAGVRSRLPAAERRTLEELQPSIWVPLHWIHNLPEPKDAATALAALRQIPPHQILPTLVNPNDLNYQTAPVLQRVAEKRAWEESDLEALKTRLRKGTGLHRRSLAKLLDCWARPDEAGRIFLAGLEAYYEVFFAEEERRILPALQASLEGAQGLAGRLPLSALLEELSQGVDFEAELSVSELILAPAYWSTPLVVYNRINAGQMVFLFGARPADMSLVPGEFVPDALIQALKALADPTRLRILRYLVHETLTPSEISRRLRLRAPTVTHHLTALRLAGLVHLTLTPDRERRYAARLEGIQSTFSSLNEFLEARSEESHNEKSPE